MKTETDGRTGWIQHALRAASALFVVCMAFPGGAYAQTLSVGQATCMPGSSVDVPVFFAAGATGVSSFQFDLEFPAPLRFAGCTTGAAAAAAGKGANGSGVPGGARLVIFGLNQTPVQSGAVAVVRMNVDSDALAGPVPIAIGGITLSDSGARAVPSNGIHGGVTVIARQGSIPPAIRDVATSNITSSTATITWTTDRASTSRVEFGTTAAYGRTAESGANLGTVHAVKLVGLEPSTVHHFRVESADAAGNPAQSASYAFRTLALNTVKVLTLSVPRTSRGEASNPAQGEEQYTGIALVNLDAVEASLTFTVFTAAGEVISRPYIDNPVERVLNPGQQLPITDGELFGSGLAAVGSNGWIRIESSSTKVAGFYMLFDGTLKVLDGANVASEPLQNFVFPVIEEHGFTKIAVTNPNRLPTDLTFELVRPDGTVYARSVHKAPATGTIEEILFPTVFPGVEPSRQDYVRVRSGRGRVLPFEMIGSGSNYLEGMNGLDADGGATRVYCPQFVFGGSWRSALSVINLDPLPGSVTLRFIGDNGAQIGATKVLPIAGFGKLQLDDASLFRTLDPQLVTQGYIEITSNGIRLTGSVVFGDPARSIFASALPLVSKLQSTMLFSHVASNDLYFTGLALLNPNATPATAAIELHDADGRVMDSRTVVVNSRQRISKLLTEIFPSLMGQNRTSGYLRVIVDQDVASFALFGTNDLSVLSAIPPQSAQ